MKYVRIPFNANFLHQPGLDTRLLIDLLGYCPKDSKIIGFGQDHSTLVNYIFVSHDSFQDVQINPPDCIANFNVDANNVVRCTGIDWPAHSGPSIPSTPVCNHVWMMYNGFMSSYLYCGICGDKK